MQAGAKNTHSKRNTLRQFNGPPDASVRLNNSVASNPLVFMQRGYDAKQIRNALEIR
jgi:hypothetical protein